MIKYENVDGKMVVSENGEWIHTSNVTPISIALKRLTELINEHKILYVGVSKNNPIIKEINLILKSLEE